MLETRVGYLSTTILEELCKEQINISYINKDYSIMLEYINKYQTLKKYNG